VTLQPLIELTSPVNGAFYTKGQVVRAVFDCYSASYPPSYCAGTEQGPGQTEGTSVVSGAAIDTGTPGAHTFTVRNASPFGSSNIQTTITYNVSGGSPPKGLTTGSASISGATGKHPKLTVKVHAARGGSPITKISIRAPAGISFVKGALKRGVSVSGGAKVSVSHRALVVKLKHAASAVTIHVASKALALSKQLRTKVRKHKLKHVIFVVDANLANGTIAELSPVVRL
jgi:hypothetical protein